jgi:hypothetical protein
VYGGDLLISKKIGRVVGNLLFSKVLSLLYLFINRQTQYYNKLINKVGSEYYHRKEKVKTFLENKK